MKKSIYVAAAALVALAGCSKNETTIDKAVEKIGVSYNTAVVKNTKAWADGNGIIENAIYPTEETFGSQAYYLAPGSTWAENSGKASIFIPEAEVKYIENDNTFSTASTYYWPQDGGSLTFFSYSPFDELNGIAKFDPTAEGGVTIAGWDAEKHPNVDVMIADPAYDQTANTKKTGSEYADGVPTIFRHKLAKIKGFNVKVNVTADLGLGEDYELGQTFVLNKIVIKNQYTEGDFDGSKWTTNNDTKVENGTTLYEEDVELSKDDYAINLPGGGGAGYVMIPQTTGEIVIEVTYTVTSGETTYTKTKPITLSEAQAEFAINGSYTYNISIPLNAEDIIKWDPYVVTWEESEFTGTF